MIELDKNSKIEVYGVCFNGIAEIMEFAHKGEPKEGVFVGEDAKIYPCFDSYDYATENRFYRNFVFAKSREEVETKLTTLKKATRYSNYCKLSDELAPMVYWQGDSHHPMQITECDAVAIGNNGYR